MSQCTAPVRGHIRGGGADCPVHGYRSGYSGYKYASSYREPVAYAPAPRPTRYASFASRSGGGGGSTSKVRRSRVTYSPTEYRTLRPVREHVERIAKTDSDRRDLFLCHAWPDRQGPALEFYNLLSGMDVKVWFSEKDVPLGVPLMRQIDKGLRNSRAGIVLVTPALLKSLESEGVAERELSALLSSGRVIPVAHGTTFEELREVSPLLASHSGLTTSDYPSLEAVAAMIADTVLID